MSSPEALPAIATPFRWAETTIGPMGGIAAGTLVGAAADVAVVLDPEGIVRDVAFGAGDIAAVGMGEWIERPWIETVTNDSRSKIAEMLRPEAGRPPRWRQVNHPASGGEVPVRYLAMVAGDAGNTIAIGRDMRSAAALQQRLLQTQQAMERDYLRLRQVEQRYRVLFDRSTEPALVIDPARRRVVEANRAAAALFPDTPELAGTDFADLFHADERDAATALLGAAAAGDSSPAYLRLARSATPITLTASLFREGRQTFVLARLATAELSPAAAADERRLLDVIEAMPDAFVLTDEALGIVAENAAFLDLAQMGRASEARGAPLAGVLGRPGVDMSLLVAQLREHGAVRNFATIVRGRHFAEEEVEVSAVRVPDGERALFGFSIRAVTRRLTAAPIVRDLPRSVEQLTDLVGRMSLKDIVRESTDLIERLCIEAALTYTHNNRASAAEILGLSRQSLYSKLHRYGFANSPESD